MIIRFLASRTYA